MFGERETSAPRETVTHLGGEVFFVTPPLFNASQFETLGDILVLMTRVVVTGRRGAPRAGYS